MTPLQLRRRRRETLLAMTRSGHFATHKIFVMMPSRPHSLLSKEVDVRIAPPLDQLTAMIIGGGL